MLAQNKIENLEEKIKANNSSVLETVYTVNFPKVEKYILSNNGTRDQAKDIYQEAFISVWEQVKNNQFLPQDQDGFNSYLYRVAKNKWLDYLRSKDYKKTIFLTKEFTSTENSESTLDNVSDLDIKRAMLALDKLGDNCKLILMEFYFKKQSLKKIAEYLIINEASARNKKYRCMQKLREMVFNNEIQ